MPGGWLPPIGTISTKNGNPLPAPPSDAMLGVPPPRSG
jgi:hypothetical protein